MTNYHNKTTKVILHNGKTYIYNSFTRDYSRAIQISNKLQTKGFLTYIKKVNVNSKLTIYEVYRNQARTKRFNGILQD